MQLSLDNLKNSAQHWLLPVRPFGGYVETQEGAWTGEQNPSQNLLRDLGSHKVSLWRSVHGFVNAKSGAQLLVIAILICHSWKIYRIAQVSGAMRKKNIYIYMNRDPIFQTQKLTKQHLQYPIHLKKKVRASSIMLLCNGLNSIATLRLSPSLEVFQNFYLCGTVS